jgi:hypothetical protein
MGLGRIHRQASRTAERLGVVLANPEGNGDSSSEPVDEICSVSNCIALGFRNDSDPFGLYANADLAWAAVPVESRADCAMYAYRLWPVQFEEGAEEPIDLWWELAVEPLAETFVRLGWDAVIGGNQYSFNCSPMSCNRGCRVVHSPDMNRYCLVSNERAALELARRFSSDQPEPGTYCVVEVWRDTATSSLPTFRSTPDSKPNGFS